MVVGFVAKITQQHVKLSAQGLKASGVPVFWIEEPGMF